MLKYLHEKGKCDLSSPSNDGRKPIHAACQCGHTDVVKVCDDINRSRAVGGTYTALGIQLRRFVT